MIKIIFDENNDAHRIFDIASNCINDLGRISVDVLYGICGIPAEGDDSSRGWTDISSAKIIREKDGYAIHFPDPTDIKELRLGYEFIGWFGSYRFKAGI